MSGSLLQVVVYAAIPAGTMIVGGVVAAFRPPGPKLRGGIQHFAAGVVFAVVAAELLPEVKREHAPVETAVSFSLGVVLMLGLRWLTEKLEKGASRGGALPWGLVAAVGIDLWIDALLLGIGFAAGGGAGFLLAVALGAELLSLGLATAATAVKATNGKRARTIGCIAGLAVVFALGGVAGVTALQGVSKEILDMVLAFGCAALLYLVAEELLVEAHEAGENPLTAAMFFVGFLALFLLDLFQSPR